MLYNFFVGKRKSLLDKGKENYKASLPENRTTSPTKGRRSPINIDKLKSADKSNFNGLNTGKSTSTISDVMNGKKSAAKHMRSDFGMFDSKDLGIC